MATATGPKRDGEQRAEDFMDSCSSIKVVVDNIKQSPAQYGKQNLTDSSTPESAGGYAYR